MHAIHDGVIKGMYVMGGPGHVDPDVRRAREALADLEHLVVQDIFLTETAWHADVVLHGLRTPRSGRPSPTPIARCKSHRRRDDPPGEAQQLEAD